LITGPVQICRHKFTRYWDIEHREIPMEHGRLLMTPEEVLTGRRNGDAGRSVHAASRGLFPCRFPTDASRDGS
jgi:hypothetical protein